MAEIADSTVAMSLYNVVASGGAETLEDARLALSRHGYLFALEDLERVLRQLVERGLMVGRDGRVFVTGPMGHVVTCRDRDDPEGWRGWRVAPFAPQRTVPLVSRAIS